MPDNKNTRTSKVFINNKWTDIKSPIDIKKGMKFRIYESTGHIVKGVNGKTDFMAKEDAYYDDNGVITVEC